MYENWVNLWGFHKFFVHNEIGKRRSGFFIQFPKSLLSSNPCQASNLVGLAAFPHKNRKAVGYEKGQKEGCWPKKKAGRQLHRVAKKGGEEGQRSLVGKNAFQKLHCGEYEIQNKSK